jgi:hypothetical protein
MTTRAVLLSRQAMARDLLARTDLTPSRRDDIEASERRLARLLGGSASCRHCGLPISNPDSVRRGAGKVCYGNHGAAA